MSLPSGCEQCRKSSLSLLLLRPSPVAHSASLSPANTAAVVSDPALTKGLAPSCLPTESRLVLRLLRPGFVHVYIAAPPPALNKNWLTFRVTEDADIVPDDRPLFKQPGACVACVRPEHNKVGLKVLTLPHAHKIEEVSLAFSANLWSPSIRAKNAANPEVMQKIVMGGSSPNTFKPTADKLRQHILECKLTQRGVYGNTKPAFAFNELAREQATDQLAEYLQSVAAAHPKTKGNELAVVLADPVGLTTELNHLRVLQHELLTNEIKSSKHGHALGSAAAADGLREAIYSKHLQEAHSKISERLTEEQFRKRAWPAGTKWLKLDAESKRMLPPQRIPTNRSGGYVEHEQRDADLMGIVRYPDHDQRAQAWAANKFAEDWSQYSPYIDDEARKRWFSKFRDMLKKRYEDALERLEQDWWASCIDKRTLGYFSSHFDAADPNDLKSFHSPGTAYSRENHLIRVPEPYSKGAVLDSYLAQLEESITDEHAVMLRAIVSNQRHFFAAVHQQLTADPGDGMRDKAYDILKDLPLTRKYGWLSDTVGAFGLGQVTALAGAVISATSRVAYNKARWGQWTLKAQLVAGVQQATEYMRKAQLDASLAGKAPNRPVLITARISAADVLDLRKQRVNRVAGLSTEVLKELRKSGASITVAVLTDSDTIRAGTDIKTILTNDTGTTAISGGTAAKEAAQAAKTAGQYGLEHAEVLRLAQQQITVGRVAVANIGQLLSGANADSLSALNGANGRLAIGCLMVQILGFNNALSTYQNASGSTGARNFSDAELGLYDSAIGLTAALVQIVSIGKDAYDVSKYGTSVATTRLFPAGLRAAGGVFGVAGSFISVIAMRGKRAAAQEAGDDDAGDLYRIAAAAFFGNLITSGLGTAGIIAETAVARGAGGVIIKAVAVRFGASATIATIGGVALSASGIGLVLLGVGLAVQLTAIALTPSALQKWFSKSYFGKNHEILWFSFGNRDERFTNMLEELKALDLILAEFTPKKPVNVKEA